MKFEGLLNYLYSLKLPPDQYVIVGSGPLAARNIREAKDLDIIVSESLWVKLSEHYPIVSKFSVNRIVLDNPDIEILGQGSAFRDPEIASVEQMIQTADIINGHPFLSLNLLKKFKQKLGREKDLKDIGLIDQYLAAQK